MYSLPEKNSNPIEIPRSDSFWHVPIAVRMNAVYPIIIPVMRHPWTVFSRFVPKWWKNRMYLINPDTQFSTNNVSVFDTNNTILLKVNINVTCNLFKWFWDVFMYWSVSLYQKWVIIIRNSIFELPHGFQNNLMRKVLAK